MSSALCPKLLALSIVITGGAGCVAATEDGGASSGDPVDDNGKGDTPSQPTQPTCSGVYVPGDYATIGAALRAGMTHICLRAQNYGEDLKMWTNATITGVGADKTTINRIELGNNPYASAAWGGGGGLVLSAVTVTNGIGIKSPSSDVKIHDATIKGAFLGSAALYIQGYSSMPNVEVMRTEIVGTMVLSQRGASNSVSIHDDEIHGGSGAGLSIESYGTGTNTPSNGSIQIDSNQIHDMGGSGLKVYLSSHWTTSPAPALSYTNNVIHNNRVGVTLDINAVGGDATIVSHLGNMLEDNVANYAGSARPDGT